MTLVTVYETIGSTYSKAGHRILIAEDGVHQGLVSGGCLEGDLAERASGVIERMTPAAVTYDLRDEADQLFGLGIGCNGLIRVLLQPLTRENDYEPFASIAECLLGDERAAVATVIESAVSGVEAGATLVAGPGRERVFGPCEPVVGRLHAGCAKATSSGHARLEHADGVTILFAPLVPVPRLLLLGAGVDAVPLVNMAVELGWRVTVADHRPSYVERDGFAAADAAVLVDPSNLAAQVDLDGFDAVVVMSHHLATDQKYLADLADRTTPFVGLLGPPARRERLIEALGAMGAELDPRLRGPVGLDIGADSPESIALSILAEIQQALTHPR